MLSSMAQPDPVYLPTRPRAHGRPRPVPYAAPTVDLKAGKVIVDLPEGLD